METLGPFKGYIGGYRDNIPQSWRTKWKRTWNIKKKLWLYKDPGIQMIPTLGPTVSKCHRHWAIWIPRERMSPDAVDGFNDLQVRGLRFGFFSRKGRDPEEKFIAQFSYYIWTLGPNVSTICSL